LHLDTNSIFGEDRGFVKAGGDWAALSTNALCRKRGFQNACDKALVFDFYRSLCYNITKFRGGSGMIKKVRGPLITAIKGSHANAFALWRKYYYYFTFHYPLAGVLTRPASRQRIEGEDLA